ncbi:MAG: chloride channel protein [Candidatus Hecatellaceae archaeon]
MEAAAGSWHARLAYLQRWVLLGALVGVVSGLGAAGFYFLLRGGCSFFLGFLAGVYPPLPAGETSVFHASGGLLPWWALPLVPTLGGLLSGFLVYGLAPEAEGHGTDAVISSFHRLGGFIRRRVPLVKAVASAITIGSGGSAGREGPIAQIGGGFGSWLASLLKLNVHDRRILMVCGAAAGIGSIFRAPLGGAMFGVEVLYRRDFETEAIVPAFIASVVAYCVFCSFPGVGFTHVFATPTYVFGHPVELVFYGALGVVCGLAARFYVYVFYGFRDRFFRRLPVPPHFKPAIGGVMLGLLALLVPQVLGTSYGWLQQAIYGRLPLILMVSIFFAKIFATSFTISSGGSGGVFAPSLVIGGMLGGIFGTLFAMVFPEVAPGAYALVGMAAFFSGAAKVPIAALIMVSEMTGNYELLAPLMLACALAYIVSGRPTIYESQVLNRAESPAHRGEYMVDILEMLRVRDVMTRKVVTLRPEASAREFISLMHRTRHTAYPVVDRGELVGIVSFPDVLAVPGEEMDRVKIRDIMSTKLVVAYPDERLNEVLRRMDETGYGHLPVVDRENPRKLVGILTRKDIIRGHETVRELTVRGVEA